VSLELVGYIELPVHVKNGGFDHAAVHTRLNRLYVAHTANDSIDVIDCAEDRYLHSIPGLAGVAGALVSEERNLVFTSNRAENTVGLFSPEDDGNVAKIPVGVRPNGLSYDPASGLLLAAHVGDPNIPGSTTVSLIKVTEKRVIATIPVPGRTRWTVFDAVSKAFYVNIAEPAVIIAVSAATPTEVFRRFSIPVSGPHGMDIDHPSARLFCACDSAKLVTLNIRTGIVLNVSDISGTPDVIFFNPTAQHLYVAVGDPGVIDVFDTQTMTRIATIPTERGAHTLAFDAKQQKVYAFLPETHRTAVYVDRAPI
jgi:DNA-binding beta-propeller fold protein YncE